jgi:hypothetical protein
MVVHYSKIQKKSRTLVVLHVQTNVVDADTYKEAVLAIKKEIKPW